VIFAARRSRPSRRFIVLLVILAARRPRPLAGGGPHDSQGATHFFVVETLSNKDSCRTMRALMFPIVAVKMIGLDDDVDVALAADAETEDVECGGTSNHPQQCREI
jgi:hypothetical protein